VLLVLGAVVITFGVTRAHTIKQTLVQHAHLLRWPILETVPLREEYGPQHNSRNIEEWVIRDYFRDRRGGVFLDVGANHYQNESNTYFLETHLGWSGVAIDALEEFAAGYAAHRPRTRFFALFVSDVVDGSAELFVPPQNKLVASASYEFTVGEGAPGKPRQVPMTTLNAILERTGIEKLDLVSMDIELGEPKALAGFAIDRYRPELVCIESHPEVRQVIIDYFIRHGYTIVAKYLRADADNLYFAPIEPRISPTDPGGTSR